MPEDHNRRKSAYILVLLLLVCGGLAVYFGTRRAPRPPVAVIPQGTPETPPAFRRVDFAELLFEQDFATLPKEGAESAAGYRWVEDARQLWPESGAQALAGAKSILGVRMISPLPAHPRVWSALLPGSGNSIAWTSVAGTPHPDVVTSFRIPVDAIVRFESGKCVITVGDRTEALAAGEARIVWEQKETSGISDLAARIRKQHPALVEPRKENLEDLRARLDPDGDGNVTLHARMAVRHWGPVHLSAQDLEGLSRAAERAGQSGDHDRAEALLRTLLSVGAEVGDLRDRLRNWRKNRTQFHRLHGTIGGPGVVAVRRSDGPPDLLRWSTRTATGEFEFFLEPGAYQVCAFREGYRPKTIDVRLDRAMEVGIELTAADRIR